MAAAGVAAGFGTALGADALEPLSGTGLSLGNIASHTGLGAASLLASAATRSAIEGSSFGANIVAGLPDVIGQVLGRALVGAAASGGRSAVRSAELAKAQAGGRIDVGATPPSLLTSAQIGALTGAPVAVSPNEAQTTVGNLVESAVASTASGQSNGRNVESQLPFVEGGPSPNRDTYIQSYTEIIQWAELHDPGYDLTGWDEVWRVFDADLEQVFAVEESAAALAATLNMSYIDSNGGIGSRNRSSLTGSSSLFERIGESQYRATESEAAMYQGMGELILSWGSASWDWLTSQAWNFETPRATDFYTGIPSFDFGPYSTVENLRRTNPELVTGTRPLLRLEVIGVGLEAIPMAKGVRSLASATTARAGRAVVAAESVPASRLAQGLEFEAGGVARARVEAFAPGQSTQRLSVRAFNADGTLAEGRTVLDMAGSRIDDGLFGSLEFKLSPNAPYTPRQQLHFPLLEQYGGVVVGRNGVPIGLPAGTRIAPTAPVRVNGPTLPQPGQWWK